MGWLRDLTKKEPEPKPPELFRVDITDEEYFALPWTIQWVNEEWHCLELELAHKNSETFDFLCKQGCRLELSKAVDGIPPRLPTGLRWKDGRPQRDPGRVRYTNTKHFGPSTRGTAGGS